MIFFLAGSHETHITGSNITVTTQYLMENDDFYNDGGELYDGSKVLVNSSFPLPQIGDKYIDYYFLSSLVNTFWEDVVLSDVTESKTNARNVDLTDSSGWDLDKFTAVTYTWTNTARKDIVTPGDQSSIRFELDTNTQLETTELIIDKDTGVASLAADLFFTQKNPDIIYYYTDETTGLPASSNKGSYVGNTEAWKRYHRENNESPSHEVYTTNTILRVTVYSKYSANYVLCDNQNSINKYDFLQTIYDKRQTRLTSKNKQPTDSGNDLIAEDDTERWLFDDYTKVETGIDMYKYEFIFKYKPDKWTRWYGATVDEYPIIDFYTILFAPLFNTGI